MKVTRNSINNQVKAFLANGGSITVCKPQATPEWSKNLTRGKGDSISNVGRKTMYHNESKGMKCNAQS